MSADCPGPDFHPHAPILAACGTGGTVEFFDWQRGAAFLARHQHPAVSCAFDGRKADGAVEFGPAGCSVYAVESGELVVSLAHTNAVRCVDWSADGYWLAARAQTDGFTCGTCVREERSIACSMA